MNAAHPVRRSFQAVAMLCVAAAAWLPTPFAHADEGHDHGPAAGAANPNAPQRLADGAVFLPKPAQRQLAVRTVPVATAELARTFELPGRVTMDPNAGGKVQSSVAGRLMPGPRGLPVLGQTVRQGEVLAHVVPSAAPGERASQSAQLAELRAAQSLAGKRLARLRELADSVPRKEIEAAEAELASTEARARAIGGGLDAREALVAPVSGVIASAQAVAGQVVDARELIYEVVNPTRLQVEALSFEPETVHDIGGAWIAVGTERVALRFLGAARSLREQALPLAFGAQGPALSKLAIGQPVKVFVQTRSTFPGQVVPAASLMKDASNQTIVWLKTGPERFEPRVVTVLPLDGVNVAVTRGLADGDRVATQGASLIHQIR